MLNISKFQASNISERLWQESQRVREIQEIIDLHCSSSSYTKKDLEEMLAKAIANLEDITSDVSQC